MATPTFDLSGLLLLENTIASMQAAQAATPSVFTGGAAFGVSYNLAGGGVGLPATMTVSQLRNKIRNDIALQVDKLPS
jgi:hypothetical protein